MIRVVPSSGRKGGFILWRRGDGEGGFILWRRGGGVGGFIL